MISLGEIYLFANLAIRDAGTLGASETAKFVAEQLYESKESLCEPDYYCSMVKGLWSDLQDLQLETAQANWDGYDAEPVRRETFDQALKFLESLPNATEPPTLGAEPDGHLTLEWHRSSDRTLSVSVSPEGMLHYASLIGPNRVYGTEVFYVDTPKEVLGLINRICA